MGLEDLIDPTTIWIPSKIVIGNYTNAITALRFCDALEDSLLVSIFPTICAVVSSALIGYGFAHYDFPFKKLWFAALVIVFLVPTILLQIPTYVIYSDLGLIGSIKAYLYPALTGFGIRQPVFIFIFYQFFKGMPKELGESAEVDGANAFQTFLKIAVPMAIPAFIICTLYSFVWYWNETYISGLFLEGEFKSLQIRLLNFTSEFASLEGSAAEINEGIRLAATLLIILPMLVVYLCLQRYFIEGVERSGIAGE